MIFDKVYEIHGQAQAAERSIYHLSVGDSDLPLLGQVSIQVPRGRTFRRTLRAFRNIPLFREWIWNMMG